MIIWHYLSGQRKAWNATSQDAVKHHKTTSEGDAQLTKCFFMRMYRCQKRKDRSDATEGEKIEMQR
jgi:hypothetical protein